MHVECITESGSTVKIDADGWVRYTPCTESIRRGMMPVAGSAMDDIAVIKGERLHLRLVTLDGPRHLTTSLIEEITVRVATVAVPPRQRPTLTLT